MKAAGPGGLAAPAPVRARRYSAGEFSIALGELGIRRSTKWVRNECHHGRIKTLEAFGRHEIPETELFRIAGIKEAAA